jgi:hypothetical protein
MPPTLGRRRAIVAFVVVLVGWVTGFVGFGWSLFAKSDAEMLVASRVLKDVGAFAALCDLTAIILGVQAIPREAGTWRNARVLGILAVTLGGIGLFGVLGLLLVGALFKDCAGCRGCNVPSFWL